MFPRSVSTKLLMVSKKKKALLARETVSHLFLLVNAYRLYFLGEKTQNLESIGGKGYAVDRNDVTLSQSLFLLQILKNYIF